MRKRRNPRPAPDDHRIAQEIERISGLDLAGVRALWRVTFKKEPPGALTRDLLVRQLAWHIQEKAFGGHDATRQDKRYDYYVSMGSLNHFDSSELGAVTRVSAPSIEEAVLGFLHRQVRATEDVANVLRSIVRRIVIRSDALEIYLHHSEGEPGTEIECGPTIIPWQKSLRA
jgi:hypothetical protein